MKNLAAFAFTLCLALAAQADAITNIEANLPLQEQGCTASSGGSLIGCQENGFGAGALAEASATFGNLFTEVSAGSYNNQVAEAVATASASFDSEVSFSQPGTIIGTWSLVILQNDEGVLCCASGATIMGTSYGCGTSEHCIITIPFTYTGGEIDISASESLLAASPWQEGTIQTLQLMSFSEPYSVAGAPEPGMLGLVGITLVGLLARKRARNLRR